MFLDELEKYASQHERWIKKICFRSSYPKIVTEPLDITLEQAIGNYDLYFSRTGRLLQSNHVDKHLNYNAIYAYQFRRLYTITAVNPDTHLLRFINELSYNAEGKVINETKRWFTKYDTSVETTISTHTYSRNTVKTVLPKQDEEEDMSTFFKTYDTKNRLIEDKAIRNEDELISWYKYEYDEKGILLREISLDEEGNPDGIYEFLPLIKGYDSGYKFSSADKNYTREHTYTFNSRGHWTSKTLSNNGVPILIYERDIEYYVD